MNIFVDTSALYALLDRDDDYHPRAKKAWNDLLDQGGALLTSNYIVVESTALVQSRLGIEAVKALHENILPLFAVELINAEIHRISVAALLTASKRKLSLVDCSSFEIMRSLNIGVVFTFDPHFREQGFTCIR